MNMSVNDHASIKAYLCRPRRSITYDELAGYTKTPVPGADVGQDVASMSLYLNNLIDVNSQEESNASILPNAHTAKNVDYLQPGYTLFQNTWFCRNFKILKTRTFRLPPGRRAAFNLQHRKHDAINFGNIGYFQVNSANWPSITRATHNPEHFIHPARCRFWFISYSGSQVPYIQQNNGAANHATIALAPMALLTYTTTKMCIRVDASEPQPLYMPMGTIATGTQTITDTSGGGALAPMRIGRPTDAYPGEQMVVNVGGSITNTINGTLVNSANPDIDNVTDWDSYFS